nr:hypothetical protein [Tanacetum cinerariifolium]
MALALMAKAFKLNYSTPTNNNKRISSNPKNRQIAQPGMNMGQDRQMQMVGGNGGNQFRQYAGQNARNPVGWAKWKPDKVLQLQGVEEYDLMAAAADLDEIKEVNANCILIANLQQASTSSTQNDSAPVYDTDGSAVDTSVEQGGETVEQHTINFEETRALYESLYQNLAIEVEKVNSVNRKLKETNADMTTELAGYKNQERCFEISQEKYDKLERCYQNPFYLKQAKKKQQCLYDGKALLEKHDPPFVHDSEETLQLAQESHDKMKQMDKEIKLANYTKINHLSGVFVPQKALSHEESYFSNNSKTADVSKSILIPNEDLSDDTTPSVARKFLNEVKSTILTLQRVVKQRMTIETHNWASFAHQELHKIVRLKNHQSTNALSKPVTSNSVSTPQESKGVNNVKVIASGMFRINPFKTSMEAKHVPNTVSASTRTKPITVSQPPVITKKDVNSDLNGLSSTGVENTKTRRPQPRSNTKHDRVPSASKLFYQEGKIVDSSKFENQSDCSNGDNACTSNILEPKIKRLPNSTSLLDSSGLDLTYAPSTITTQQPSEGELDLLFETMYDDYIGGQQSATGRTVPPPQEPVVRQTSTASTTIEDTAPTLTNSSSLATNILITSEDVDELNSNAIVDGNTFVNPFENSSTSVVALSSSQNVDPSNMHTFYQPYSHEFQWTKDHPLE